MGWWWVKPIIIITLHSVELSYIELRVYKFINTNHISETLSYFLFIVHTEPASTMTVILVMLLWLLKTVYFKFGEHLYSALQYFCTAQ